MRISMCVFTAAMFASAIGSTADGATDSKYAGIHTVEVISALGDDIDMQKVGPKIFFENIEYKLHTDWHIDDMISGTIQKVLGPRFEVRISPDHNLAFQGIKGLGLLDRGEIKRKLASLSGEPVPDAYVIVAPYTFAVGAVGYTGLLVQRAAGITKEGRTSFGAYYKIAAFDGRTGAEIDYGTSQWPAKGFGHEPPIEGCPGDIWADTADTLTDEQKGRIRQEIDSLITRSIAYTLASAGLLDRKSADATTAEIAVKADPSCLE